MAWKIVSLLGIALIALSDARPPVSEQKVKIENVGKNSEHHEAYVWSYPSYEFSYEVSDPHTHDFKGHHETRKGDDVKGYYWLIQPDGLKRTVKYHADKNSGLEAHVDYEKKNEENNNDENNESNQEENSNQENTSGGNGNEETGEENQESNGNNGSNNKQDISSNESENSRNENNGEGNAEGENQEQEGINMSELEEISRKNYNDHGGEQKGGYYRGRKYMGRRNEFYKTGLHSYRGKVKYGQTWHYNNGNNNEESEPENNNEENNNEDSAGQVEQENNSNNNEESDNNEEGNGGENQEGDNADNEQSGENANEESSLNSEKSDHIAQKTEYHVIIHHPKYISMSKKSKRRT
ncbi:myb-like protein D [Melitaea cinxia]|uniref:myb-like protein D n=1 Tax=Melitaea cinxia TaxID=113334 RepID=UPI001E270991|nr:myb-like protein D [Melitaea cinxia]